MNRVIEARRGFSLDSYEAVPHLNGAARDLRREAERLRREIEGRRVWMVNSSRHGGGVAELLPPLVSLMGELGVETNWIVMEPAEPAFFQLTKRLHNLIHGEGDLRLGPSERELYERVSRQTAETVGSHLAAGDILVIHDPQPMGAGALLRRSQDIAAIWRCHIGLDLDTERTRAAWAFLEPYAEAYDRAVFTAPDYIPRCLAGRATIIHPAIDPLSHKNRELPIHKLVGILVDSALIPPHGPVLAPPFPAVVQRLQPDGSWAPACEGGDIGLLFRPIVTQISRWDHLKGFLPLLRGFVALKQGAAGADGGERCRRTLELARLVLAGPEPGSIQDDPEGREVLDEVSAEYRRLPPELQEAVAILSLPMASPKHNALIVNALQRCSDVVVQNSLREGFGLTATEAMWKRVAVVGSSAAGLRQQIRPGLDGCLVADPEDAREIAQALGDLLCDQPKRDALARSAQQRVHDQFLVFTQVRRWLEVIAETVRLRWG
jgi:trehalose synthase